MDLPKTNVTDFMNLSPKTVDTSSGWNLSSWLWYIGIGVVTAGAIYLGYVIITDPSIITPYRDGVPGRPNTPPSGPEGIVPPTVNLNDDTPVS